MSGRKTKMLKEIPTGGALEALLTDRRSVADVAAFFSTTGDELVQSSSDYGVYRFISENVAHVITKVPNEPRVDVDPMRLGPDILCGAVGATLLKLGSE
jgi:TusA-related sulfurtransferase